MNSETGFSSKLRRLTALVHVCVNDPRGTRHRARNIAPHTHMRVAPSRVVHHLSDTLFRCSIRGSSPSVDCGFDARRTSHSVAVHRAASTIIPHSGGHRARKGGSMLYCGISQPLFVTVRPPGSNAADQASWNS